MEYSNTTYTRVNRLIYLLILSLPFSWASFIIGSVYRTITIIAFVIFLIMFRFKIPIWDDNKKLASSWLAYIIYAIVTGFWGVNHSSALVNSFSFILLSFIVIIFFSAYIDDNYQQDIVDTCWIIGGVICILLYLFGDRASVGIYGSRTTMMILGTETDPNEFASAFIVPASLLCYRFINTEKTYSKLLHILIIILSLYCVLMSGSRGALFSVILAMTITIFQSSRKNLKSVLLATLIIIISLFIVFRFVLPMIPTDVLTRLSFDTLVNDRGSGRSDIWKDALNRIGKGSLFRLFFGYGQYGLIVQGSAGYTTTMHNQFIQQLSNYGIVGLVFYVNLMVNTFKYIRVRCPRYIGSFWGMILMSCTITMSVAYKILWILLLLPACVRTDEIRE